MRRQKLQDSELDKLGIRLIAAGRLTEAEVEQIASSPFLLSRIRAQISASPAAVGPALNFGRITALASGSLALVAAAISIATFAGSGDPTIATRKIQTPPSKVSVPGAISKKPDTVTEASTDHLEITPVRRPQTALLRRLKKDRAVTQPVSGDSKPPIEFMPINYAGDPSEMSRGRVIRVEMPRASLFAMGINVPLENASEMVKADLLVGADGVTRAVRIVD